MNYAIGAITPSDNLYPALLREIPDMPRVLFYRGNLEALNTPALAVVGSRKMSSYGSRIVHEFIPTLAAHFAIVSGLALGIDGEAHRSALDCNGTTAAVVGSGLDDKSLYPQSHLSLSHHILENNGLLLSEYPVGTAAAPYFFPVRNRILAGLSRGVIIVEAAIDSGTMITARMALDYNRDVFAIPGSIFSPLSAGTHELLKHGAAPATCATDILSFYDINTDASAKQPILLDADELALTSHLTHEPKNCDELLGALEWDIARLTRTASRLELADKIKKIAGRGWVV